jgi:hypothetical protein
VSAEELRTDTYTRADGIRAIIHLQAFVKIEETEESAARGWDNLTKWEQHATIQAHAQLCEECRRDQ